MANVSTIAPIAKGRREEDKAPNKTEVSFWTKISMHFTVFKSMRQASKIMKGLNEAEQIRAGKKQGKLYNDFLKEI